MRIQAARAMALVAGPVLVVVLSGCNAAEPQISATEATASGEATASIDATASVDADQDPTPSAGPVQPPGCSIFPADNVWHADVSALPVHDSSAAWVQSIGADRSIHPDFGSGLWEGAPFGIPITLVAPGQPAVDVSFEYADESDDGPYPIPADVRIEGGPQATGDRHVILLDTDACVAYELYAAYPQGDGTWRAGSGAIFDLRSNQLRPAGWTSADAAGLPIIAGLVRYEEVAAGSIDHAIRFTAPRTRNDYLWPARHAASRTSDAALPPMGARFRLKASVDTSGFPPQARVIAEALKRYGMILADNGSSWYLRYPGRGLGQRRAARTEVPDGRRLRGGGHGRAHGRPQLRPGWIITSTVDGAQLRGTSHQARARRHPAVLRTEPGRSRSAGREGRRRPGRTR